MRLDRISVDRRSLLKAAGFALTGSALVASPRASAQQPFAGKTVKVGLSGGGSWRDSVDKLIGAKLKELGGAVEWVIDAPQGNIAKMFAARGGAPPFDVLESGLHLVQTAQRGIAELDYAKIPNAAQLPANARGKDYVWNCASEDGIVYNRELFEKNGIPAPQQYKDLAHPKLRGKVAVPDVNHVQHWNVVVGLAYDAGATEAKLEAAVPLVNEIKPSYFYATSTDLATKMGAGDIWAAAWHAGWAVRLRRNNVPLAVSYPKIGSKKGALWPVILQQTRNAAEPAMAAKFIDLYLDPQIQASHAVATGVVPIHPASFAALAADPLNKELLLLDQKDINNMFVVDFSKIDQARWRDIWNKDINRS